MTAFEPFKADAQLDGLKTVGSTGAGHRRTPMPLLLLVKHTALRSLNPATLAHADPGPGGDRYRQRLDRGRLEDCRLQRLPPRE